VILKPARKMTTDEWARTNRILPPSAGRPGPFEPSVTPFMVPVARAFDDPRYGKVALVCGSQMSKTETCLNVIGSRLDQRPAPIIYVGPSKDFLYDQLEPRFTDLLDQSKSLKDKVARGKKSRKSRKLVAGVNVLLAWAGSSTPLKSTPAGLVLVDERDGMDANIQGEGDPVELVQARGDTYADFKLGITSTPTEGNVDTMIDPVSGLERWRVADHDQVASPIWRLWQEGTRYEWAWPCPHCGEFFIPRFKLLRWPDGASAAETKETAFLECPHCTTPIEEAHKEAMNARGLYLAPGQSVTADGIISGEPPSTDTISFWVSGLCSPFRTFGDRAARYLAALQSGDSERLKAVINTGFGELYAIGGGEAPQWTEVAALRQPYRPRELPLGVIILTCGVDVQKNRLIYAIRGWGARFESWLIEAGELWGETHQEAIWGDLERLIARRIDGVSITTTLIDTGYRPGDKEAAPVNMVYEFCRRVAGTRAVKGRDVMDKPYHVSRIEVDVKGRTQKAGLSLWHLNTDYFKSWAHGRIHWPEEQPGGFHLHSETSEDYCKQLVAEARVVKASGKPVWIKIRHDNHFLDCEMLNAAAAHMERVDLIPDGAFRAHTIVERPVITAEPEAVAAPVAAAATARSFSRFAAQLNGR
jgi:phage terminase large subunit GpA-like protein